MASSVSGADFIVWGLDQTPYGPVELPMLVSWVKDERVLADTWIFVLKNDAWQKASELPELHIFFRSKSKTATPSAGVVRGIDPRALRRVKILASMTDEQIERFTKFAEVERVSQFAVIVKQGDPGDAMYFILDGELRVRIDVAGRETVLTTLGVGEFFGDISLFDSGPRSADVVANQDSTVVKISAQALDTIAKEAPDLAATFLRAIGRTLTARIRADNKRYGDSVKFARAAE